MMGTQTLDETLQIKHLQKQISILEKKQQISSSVIQDYQKRVATISNENRNFKETCKSLAEQVKEFQEQKSNSNDLRKEIEKLLEVNQQMTIQLNQEKIRNEELSREYQNHVQITSQIGNKQLGQLKSKTEMIHSLESDVIQTFRKPIKLLWNSVVEKDILKLNQQNWIPDNECTECHDCKKVFGLLTRKHHCRKCGLIFCADDLVKAKVSILEKVADPEGIETKICKQCYPLIQVFIVN